MEEKLLFIREALIEKMYSVVKADKITSTEQLLNLAKAYCELSESAIDVGVIAPVLDTI